MQSGGLVGCTQCGGSHHPFSYVRANPLPETLSLHDALPISLDDLDPPFVDRSSHYLSACSIKHFPKPIVSWSSQGSIVQRSFPHKCNQEVWWDALNVVASTIRSIMLGLTPSPKLFLYSMTSSGNVPLVWPYCPSV